MVAGLIVDGFAFCLGRAVDVRGTRARTDCIVVTCIHMRHPLTHPLPFHPHATLSWVQKKPKFTHFSFMLFGFIYCGSYKNEIVRELAVFFFVVAYITTHTGFDGGSCFFFVVYTFLLECIFWFYYTRWLGCFVARIIYHLDVNIFSWCA